MLPAGLRLLMVGSTLLAGLGNKNLSYANKYGSSIQPSTTTINIVLNVRGEADLSIEKSLPTSGQMADYGNQKVRKIGNPRHAIYVILFESVY